MSDKGDDMTQIYPDAALVPLLQRLLTGGINLHLFANNAVIDQSITLSGLTEAAWAGYAVQNVPAAAFTLTGVAAHVGGATAAAVAFGNTSGGNQSAYGYYATDAANTVLLWCARFDAAPIVQPSGGSWVVTPTVGDFSQAAA